MREVINLSLPKTMARSINVAVKENGYASKSEFFRSLFRMWQEGRTLKELTESRQELATGKGKILRSLADLR